MRLGDLDALKDRFSLTGPIGVSVRRVIDKAPTIDAVHVVRCRECKHRDPENHHCGHATGATIYFPRKDDDFCSYGEQKGG